VARNLSANDTCFFLNDDYESTQGVVVGSIYWRGERMIVIGVEDEHGQDFYVRPSALVARDANETIGFGGHDDALMAAMEDLVLAHRFA
jgi:hypothetical protein